MNFISERHPGSPALHSIAGPQNGPVLLFLHGLGRFSEDYLDLATELSRSWLCVALDFRGHGSSGRAAEHYLVTDYVDDTLRLLQDRFAEPVVICGHSLGAMVALAAAARLPARVRGIILEDPPFHTMGQHIHQTAWATLFAGMQQVSRQGGSTEEMAEALGNIHLPSRRGNRFIKLRDLRSAASLTFSARCLRQADPSIFTAPISGQWLEGYDERQLFEAVRCPALLLQGDPETGAALTDEDAEAAEKLMPLCQRIRFPNTGHMVRAERPAEVLRLVEEFAAKLPPFSSTQTHIQFNPAAEAASLDEQTLRTQNNQSNRPYV